MAKKKSRIDIPKDVAARVLFLSDRTCCICRQRSKRVQIHHIDDDPSNNSEKNLAVVCFDCHQETQIQGGFDRKLDAAQVILYRDDWHNLIARQRATVSTPEHDLTPGKTIQQEGTLLVPQLEMLAFKPKTVEIDRRPVLTLAIPFRNNSGITIKDIAAQIRFENEDTSEKRDVNYGFWAEAEGKRISLKNGDTGHIALVSAEKYMTATLDNKYTRKYVTAYCEMKVISKGVWRVEIELIGDSFQQTFPPFRIDVAERGVYRLT